MVVREHLIFLDDILVFGNTNEQHQQRLEKVKKRLEERGLELNTQKCVLGVKEVKFLGHTISASDGIRPSLDKVSAIRNFRHPENAAELNSFLGLVNYVGKFIPNLSTLADPLRTLSRKKEFSWSKAEEVAFQKLRNVLSDKSSLGFYNPNDETAVITDASPVGLGAVLIQYSKSKVPRVICYISRSLSDVERRYSQTEKEALALVWACERLKFYLIGRSFDLISDHKPLELIFGPKSKPCARLERWLLRIQAFKYKVIYQSGKTNIADPFSRLLKIDPNLKTKNDIYEKNVVMWVEELVPRAISLQELKCETGKDAELQKVIQSINSGVWSKELKPYVWFKEEFGIINGIVLRGSRIVVPKNLQRRTLGNAHEGHPGIVKMKDRLRSKVWWPGIDKAAENGVKCCQACQRIAQPEPPVQMSRRKLPEGPWQDVALDFLGPLPSGEYLLTVIDYFSRFVEVKVLRSIMAKETIQFLSELFARYGFPYSLITDNGSQLTSREFSDYCASAGITLLHTPPFWPQANGEIERQNRSLLKGMKIAQLNKTDWKKELLDYLLMYRATPHVVTGKSPAELLFKRPLRDKLPMVRETEIMDEVRDKDQINKGKSKDYADSKRKAIPVKELEIGDEVWIQRTNRQNKLDPTFEAEPGRIVAMRGPEVSVQTPTRMVTRNSSFFKKVITENDEAEKGKDNQESEGTTEEKNLSGNNFGPLQIPLHTRSSERVRSRPKRFDDFVLK